MEYERIKTMSLRKLDNELEKLKRQHGKLIKTMGGVSPDEFYYDDEVVNNALEIYLIETEIQLRKMAMEINRLKKKANL